MGFLNGIERGKAFRLQEAKLQTNRSQGLKRSRSETSLSVQEEKHNSRLKKKRREEVPEITFPTVKNNYYEIAIGIERGKAFRFKTPCSILIVGPSGCSDLFYRIVTLGSFGRIVCEPSARDSLLLRSVEKLDSEP